MIPKKVVLENFLSFGDPVTIEFADGEPLWVLCGPNGVGKSAVFDAITFALFGAHRGGTGRGMEDLVRHGANGFRVEFEFAFDGADYRIVRNWGKRPVQRVYRRVQDDWDELDLPASKDKVRAWAEANLGLTFEQFTASVLLRQGMADAIITAGGKDRLAMLKAVLGVERYERLSARVHDAARARKARRDELAAQLARTPDVPPDELTSGEAGVKGAQDQLDAAREAEAGAAARVEQARQWAELDRQRIELDRRLADADARRQHADRIRRDHARLAELAVVVTPLRELVGLRDRLTRAEPALEALRRETVESEARRQTVAELAEVARARAEEHRQAADAASGRMKELTGRIERTRQYAQVADEIEDLGRRLGEFPADLDGRLTATAEALRGAEADTLAATEKRTTAAAHLTRAVEELSEFGSVEVGVRCSHCGQTVTAEHAEREWDRMARQVELLRKQVAEAKATESDAADRHRPARAEHDRLASLHRDRQKVADKVDDRIRTLARLGVTASATELRGQLETDERDLTTARQSEQTERSAQTAAAGEGAEADRERKALDDTLGRLAQQARTAEAEVLRSSARRDALAAGLPNDWPARWSALTAADVGELDAERDRLTRSGVADEFRRLQEDDARQDEWNDQRGRIAAQIEAVPADARIPVAVASEAARAAKESARAASNRWGEAKQALDALAGRRNRHAELRDQLRAAERDHDRHSKLDELLGPAGLQRELVRSAERQIVRFANETVRNLSDGDLTIELDAAEDGPDKAFTLRVRRSEDPTPIGVHYLSGSQKFRVAVAVALGIGRFAASGTQAKPLESVIIDEGFGSLDKDGLRAMADELLNLQRALALKRIVLVSHQEEFTGRFPVGWWLTRTPNGTAAVPFRRG